VQHEQEEITSVKYERKKNYKPVSGPRCTRLFVVAAFLRQMTRHEQVNILQQKARGHAQLESER
jgi:ribosomal protein L21